MVRLSSHTPVDNLLMGLLYPMLLLELQPPRPDFSKIAILRQCTPEPFPGFLDLTFGPKDFREGADYQGVIFQFSEGVRRACLPSWARLRPDG